MDSEKQGLTLLEVERSVSDDVDRPSTSQSVDRGHFGENLACLDLNPSRTASTLEINHETTLFDIKEGLMALTGSFKRFVDANTCNANVNVEREDEQLFTIVRPNMNMSRFTNPRKRAREYFDEQYPYVLPTTHLLGKIMRKLCLLLFQTTLKVHVQGTARLILEALICPRFFQRKGSQIHLRKLFLN